MLAANDVASVIIARSDRAWIDAMSLQKLLYYAQAWHLAVSGEPLFAEQVKAWKDGPVVPQVWHDRKDTATRRAVAQQVDGIELDELASNLIDLVISAYGSMSAEELSALTHTETPWRTARAGVPDDQPSSEPISPDEMASFYRGHRQLGGRSAADLAAGGVHLRSSDAVGPVDVDSILAQLGQDVDDDDPWGAGNLTDSRDYGSEGIDTESKRSFADC